MDLEGQCIGKANPGGEWVFWPCRALLAGKWKSASSSSKDRKESEVVPVNKRVIQQEVG